LVGVGVTAGAAGLLGVTGGAAEATVAGGSSNFRCACGEAAELAESEVTLPTITPKPRKISTNKPRTQGVGSVS
jgi:hypothetical protein